MNKFWSFVIDKRKFILVITAVIVIASIILTIALIFSNKINSDLLAYLPENTETGKGFKFLTNEFDIKGDGMFVVEGDEPGSQDYLSLVSQVNELASIDGVSHVIWYESIKDLDILASIFPGNVDISSLQNFLRRPQEDSDKYNYVVLLFMDYSPSTEEAFYILDSAQEIFSGREYAVDGMTATARSVMRETIAEAPLYIIFGVLAVLIVLFLVTSSYIEPLILIITLGVSIIINMGTNLIFPEISIITFAASSVLQLGISMDYAIFYMHRYKEAKREIEDSIECAKYTSRTVYKTILASSLTTIGGFAALIFMEFDIGLDIGRVIMKGVALSLITVLALQPCLIIMLDKVIKKTSHKPLEVNFEKGSSFVIKYRYVFIVLAVVLIVPAFIGQSMTNFSYFKLFAENENPTSQEQLALELRNQLVVAVPLNTVDDKSHQDFIKDIKNIENIGPVLGAFEALKVDHKNLTPNVVRALQNLNPYVSSFFKIIEENGEEKVYTLYTITIMGDTETEESFTTFNAVSQVIDDYFEESYKMGMTTGVNDMRIITPRDFLRITIISATIILLIMAIILKSLRKSLIMVLLIELSIWINISITYLLGGSLNFMVYILISSVQLGCTVDYAILICSTYDEEMTKLKDSVKAAKSAIQRSFQAVLTSAGIIFVTCIAVYFVSNNLIVKEITFLLARGAFISFVVIILVLPGILVLFKKILPIKQEIAKAKEELEKAKAKAKEELEKAKQKLKDLNILKKN